ncbi:DUF4376 domain-containing protein [Brevundimonas vancanneytii]|uniref:DUF4376 domain-containing protein n=1 Tax=Brevundimonas vancanneytii TaxID=1325724 RepID=A0A4P1JU51_9CAUL|nr:DUF4376 domain-containing protein [Brevundimonas vancanneytii]VTO10709.1 Uncharacterised protein [Brevundimonas vancanneytii]
MTWHLNNAPAPRDPSSGWLIIDDVQYPPDWPHDDLLALGLEWVEPEPPARTAEEICRQIDAERDRRTALDFAYDFGATPAVDDSGAQIAAGERLLQMRPEDQRNWQALQGAALTAIVSGAPDTTLPMRAEDNWNIQTTAAQVLQVLAAMTAHASALLFHGGALKSQVRAAEDPASVDWMAGWPGDV